MSADKVDSVKMTESEEKEIDEIIDQTNNYSALETNREVYTNDADDDVKFKLQTHKKSKKGRKNLLVVLSILAVILLIVGTYAYHKYRIFMELVDNTINVDTFYEGIYINDISMAGLSRDEAMLKIKELEPNLRPDIELNISCSEKIYKLCTNDLNFKYNTDDIMEQAYSVGRNGKDIERYKFILSLRENPQNFTVDCRLDDNQEEIAKFISSVANDVDVEARSDYVGSFHPNSPDMFEYKNGYDGQKLDEDDLKNRVNIALEKGDYKSKIRAIMNNVPKPSTDGKPSLKEQTVLLSSFSTVARNSSNSKTNMKVALDSINGKVLEPGEVFSFNECTGDSNNAANGYLPATAIKDGEFVEEYGGGICQAATTVYGAALRADMEIVARSCHSYPSTYCPIGQDATIAYPYTDFKFKNSSEYTVFVKAWMKDATLTVEIYGYHPTSWDEIQITSSGNEDNTRASAEKKFYKNGAVVKTEAIASSYYKKK